MGNLVIENQLRERSRRLFALPSFALRVIALKLHNYPITQFRNLFISSASLRLGDFARGGDFVFGIAARQSLRDDELAGLAAE